MERWRSTVRCAGKRGIWGGAARACGRPPLNPGTPTHPLIRPPTHPPTHLVPLAADATCIHALLACERHAAARWVRGEVRGRAERARARGAGQPASLHPRNRTPSLPPGGPQGAQALRLALQLPSLELGAHLLGAAHAQLVERVLKHVLPPHVQAAQRGRAGEGGRLKGSKTSDVLGQDSAGGGAPGPQTQAPRRRGAPHGAVVRLALALLDLAPEVGAPAVGSAGGR